MVVNLRCVEDATQQALIHITKQFDPNTQALPDLLMTPWCRRPCTTALPSTPYLPCDPQNIT